MNTKKKHNRKHGIALLAAMIFIIVFSAISVGFLSLSSANAQMADNHRAVGNAMNAALSGMDCARYLLAQAHTVYTSDKTSSSAYTSSKTVANTISTTEANTMWAAIYSQLNTQLATSSLGATSITKQTDSSTGTGYILASGIKYLDTDGTFSIQYSHSADNPNYIYITCTGINGSISRTTKTSVEIIKDATAVKYYGVAGRGRVWLAGDTTVYGDIYSSYAKYTYNTDGSIKTISNTTANLAPFEMEADSTVVGSLNTVLTEAQVAATSDNTSELLGTYDGINYGVSATDISGLSVSDYDTSSYKSAISSTTITASTVASSTTIQDCTLSKSSSTTVTEYFPHASGSYTTKSSSSSLSLKRYKYSSKTFTNVTVSAGENALFDSCTFNGVLYINCNTSGPTTSNTSTFNNIRFNNCTFNGTIITNVPASLNTNWWMANCLYFTGTATFENNSGIEEATILAPNFNINLGNTNSDSSANNTLTGAVIGGIVDVRGNANIDGTIISTADTSSYTSGYVSNIGATLDDGGSETTDISDIGTIVITCNTAGKLPYGIKTPVVLDMSSFTTNYSEN